MKSYFLKSNLLKYLVVFNIILLAFGVIPFLLFFIIILLIVYSYRKIKLDNLHNKDIELNAVFSPLSGKVKNIETHEDYQIINLKPSLVGPLGFYMPFSGTIDKVEKNEITIYNKLGQNLVITYSAGLLNDSVSWLRTGDLANYSANIGFLGLGGSISILTKKDIKILVEKNQRVFAGQSIIAGFEVNNER